MGWISKVLLRLATTDLSFAAAAYSSKLTMNC
jgi:hypothetical protein